jgi:hypothetical protein
LTTPVEEGAGKGQPEDPEGSEGSTAKRADSTNNMPTENEIKGRVQMEKDAQMHFNAMFRCMSRTHAF